MDRFVVAVALIVLAAAVAAVLRRRRPAPPTQARWQVPTQLDRDDFDGAGQPWLVVVFTSATCESCHQATAKAAVLASDAVAVQEVSFQTHGDLHARYTIDAVPTIVAADNEGIVRAAFVGVPSATDLWAALAEARDPGSSPEPGLGRVNN